MPPLSVMIKPSSSNCNLRCNYCFYHSLAEKREISSYGFMNVETLENVLMKALEYAEGSCTFLFQGGEPTLIGLDFYKDVIEFEEKYNVNKVKIYNSIQTNGLLINEEWAKFLSENKFLVGISLDGPKEIHDLNRVDINNNGTFNEVMKAIDLFKKYKVEYNVLFVVNAAVARYGKKIYKFFKKNNFKYIQFIPCLDPLGEARGNNKYSLKPEAFGKFINDIFECWYEDIKKGEYISIRYFDNLISKIMGYSVEACDMKGICSCGFVIEADGGVYPCDFYVTDKWYMGNVKESEFKDLASCNVVKSFIDISKTVDPQCRKCRYFMLCKGGCRRNRESLLEDKLSLNYLCPAYKYFFDNYSDKLIEVAKILSRKKL